MKKTNGATDVEGAKNGDFIRIPNEALVAKRSPTPMDMLQCLIETKADPEVMKAHYDLVKSWKDEMVRMAFNEGMNACQKEMPTVVKDKRNAEINKMYAPVETIQTYAKPVYIKHGFSLSFGTEIGSDAGLTHFYVDVLHVAGHTKRYYLHNVPLDTKGPKGGATKNDIQGLISSTSYAQGRLIRMAFNITVADEDRDGQLGHVTEEQIGKINDAIEKCEAAGKPIDFKKFKEWIGVEDMADMPASKVVQVLSYLELRLKTK